MATATVRYVSKAGTSTPPYTSWATASDSIQKCINICQNGDTVFVANGVYKENLVINTEIALIGSSMDSTLIDGRGLGDITVNVNTLLKIENFNIYGKGNGIGNAFAIRALSISNCKISETGIGVSCVNAPLNASNLYMKNLRRGFSLASAVNPFIYNISDCVINLNNSDATGVGISFAENATAYINNNIIIFDHQFNNPSNGIYLGLPRKVYIDNNLISGFIPNVFIDAIMDTVFFNNNVFLNTKDGASIIADVYYTKVKNVILYQNNLGITGSNRVKSDFNLFWRNGNDLYQMNYGDSDRVADPMFVNDSVQSSNYDFHLQAFSPAIDKGDPNILDVDGTRSDIGMYGGPFGEITYYKDLAPRPPRNISAIADSNNTKIRWNRNSEADTAFYRVYRDTVQNFTLDSTKLAASPTDTFYVHATIKEGDKYYYYKVTCVDKHGHESKPSEEIVIRITSINDYPMTINDFFLYQNYPNPFNPSTTIGYKLKERGYVKLMVYDIKGELVSVLVNQEQESGYYEVEFNTEVGSRQLTVGKGIASGIYLYRMEVIDEGNIPVYTEMKKMLKIK